MHYGDYTKDHSQLNDLFKFLGEPVDREVIERTFSKRLKHARSDRAEDIRDVYTTDHNWNIAVTCRT